MAALSHGAAHRAGLSVLTRAVQLWNVGAGLPLDALRKGAITSWACPYELSDEEIPSLIDALAQQCASPHWDVRRDAHQVRSRLDSRASCARIDARPSSCMSASTRRLTS